MNYALIGYPLSHSFSPNYFAEKFELEGLCHTYQAMEIQDLSELRSLILQNSIKGFNVTIPHKQAIIPFLDQIAEDAQAIGAVNTVAVENDYLYGFNTDYLGFMQSLDNRIKPESKAIILGNGGASLAVQYALQQMTVPFFIAARNGGDLSIDQLDKSVLMEHHLIVNTTPVGMYPHLSELLPFSLEGIGKNHIVYDLIYNPEKTMLLLEAEQRGAQIINGLEMLVRQAELSWQIWNQ